MVEDKAILWERLEEKKATNFFLLGRKQIHFSREDTVRQSNWWSPVITHPHQHHDQLTLWSFLSSAVAALPRHPPCETQTSEMGHAPRSCWLRTLHLFSGPPSGITPTQFWRYTPPAVPPALPGTQHPLAHTYVPPSGPSRPTKAGVETSRMD